MSLFLPLEIVATDNPQMTVRAQDECWGWPVGKQRTQAVASLEMRRRVAASFEVSWEFDPYVCWWLLGPWIASYGPRARTQLANLLSTTIEQYSTRFAQLAMGCSNPAFKYSPPPVSISAIPLLPFHKWHSTNTTPLTQPQFQVI